MEGAAGHLDSTGHFDKVTLCNCPIRGVELNGNSTRFPNRWFEALVLVW